MTERFDVVIIGGGSAGSVLANRLTEDASTRVLVLEAGRPDYPWDVFVHMPAALTFPIGSRWYDWGYESEPEPHLNDRRIYHARGRLLGGSSSINGMIFQRGNPLDYERWSTHAGMSDWDYPHCLPYFRRMEDCAAAAADDAYEFALRANTDDRDTRLRHPTGTYTATSGVSAHRTGTSSGGARVSITDFDGNVMEVVYRPPAEYPSHYTGSTVRHSHQVGLS